MKGNLFRKWAKPDPYSAFTALPGTYAKKKTVNSHGFISTPEISLEKKADWTRIIFLGGSSTAGTGIKNLADEKTWPWKTVKKLKQETNNKNIDFINAALGGYSTFESYGKLWSRLRFYKPDIIIVYHGWNEMSYFKFANNPIYWRANFDINRTYKLKKIWRYFYIAKTRFLFKNTLERNTKRSPTKLQTTFNEEGLNIYRDNIKLIRDFCLNNNIQFYFCKQPTLIHFKTKEKDQTKCRYKNHGFSYEAHIQAFESIYKIIDDEIPFKNIIDITSISGSTDCFYDHIHPTEYGTDKISEIVKDSLFNTYFSLKK